MHPEIFVRSIEEQLRRVKSQYLEISESTKSFDINHEELLKNAQIWFLRTVQNSELTDGDIPVPTTDCVSYEAIAREKIPPYNLKNPALAWMICSLDKEQIDTIFGAVYYDKIMGIAREFKITGFGSTFIPERRR